MPPTNYIEAITQAIDEEMARDDRVFCLGEDIGKFGGAFKATKGLFEKYGADRVRDTPLAESGIIGVAIGAALLGMRPIAEMQFIDFISCGFNQIVNQAAKIHYRWGARVPLVIRGPCGGMVRGGPFHSQSPEAWFTHTAGLKVVAPSTPADAKGLLKSAVRDDNPVIYLEHKWLYRRPSVRQELPPGADRLVPIGRAEVKRPGRDATVITYSAMVHLALEAAEVIQREDGAAVEVVDLRTLVPLDKPTLLDSVRRTSRVLVLHEAAKTGGFGGEVAAVIAEEAFEHLDAPVRRLAALDTPVPYAPTLEDAALPSVGKIVAALRELLAY
ncbi:MAG: alpha-ketoacid dehydrogenase subunit beta [Planctomycetes bacterium]|nr:alpha-ketoacid dehydrogenase subunit beta [Planctomycetota bacterium]